MPISLSEVGLTGRSLLWLLGRKLRASRESIRKEFMLRNFRAVLALWLAPTTSAAFAPITLWSRSSVVLVFKILLLLKQLGGQQGLELRMVAAALWITVPLRLRSSIKSQRRARYWRSFQTQEAGKAGIQITGANTAALARARSPQIHPIICLLLALVALCKRSLNH